MKNNQTRKNESPGFAWALYSSFVHFFGLVTGFVEKRDSGSITFVREFPEKKLQIVVTAPLFIDAQKNMYSLSGLYIQFEVQFTGKKCLELVDSRVFPGYPRKWQPIAKKKIDALVAHIEDIFKCPRCTDKELYPYPEQLAETQIYHKPTKFVQNRCPGCENVYNSSPGKGIKMNLHPFLKKKKKA